MREPKSVDDIVQSGLCIGCGLCAAVAGSATIEMAWTAERRLRPHTLRPLDPATMDAINRSCPGVTIAGLSEAEAGPDAIFDPVWGWLRAGWHAWASDEQVRFESSAGGVCNALAIDLLERNVVSAILHVGPDPVYPARSSWRISRNRDDVLGASGSRYGPAAPLAGLEQVLARNEPFAFFGKPCDVSALRLRAHDDRRIAQNCLLRTAIVCGGASEFGKTLDLLAGWNIKEEDVAAFRYRGCGNPGPTTARTKDGETFSVSYNELWEDEGTWALQSRCKICPDAIGMAADLIVADCWPGGGPSGEDEGYNVVFARTAPGEAHLADAVAASAVTLAGACNARDLDHFQPHQVVKRRAVWARFAGLRAAGNATPRVHDLAIEALAIDAGLRANLAEARGTRHRLHQQRFREPRPIMAD